MKKTVISFDFDGCVGSDKKSQMLFMSVSSDPSNDVHITTQRYDNTMHVAEWRDVAEFAKRAGLPMTNIHFTNRQDKYMTLSAIGASAHFDDDIEQIIKIKQHLPSCVAILV